MGINSDQAESWCMSDAILYSSVRWYKPFGNGDTLACGLRQFFCIGSNLMSLIMCISLLAQKTNIVITLQMKQSLDLGPDFIDFKQIWKVRFKFCLYWLLCTENQIQAWPKLYRYSILSIRSIICGQDNQLGVSIRTFIIYLSIHPVNLASQLEVKATSHAWAMK